ncbi:MAG: cupin domain-containing protein [Gammaproteobacteria bacterium]|nr:cupin domain-containing protein [Gammaproteobacteria bacterium]
MLHALGSLTPEQFLRDYWQKKPCVIRQGFPDFQDPLEPEELAGLACEEDVESRIVLEKGGKHAWEVRHGPFKESHFTKLPATHWTVLVQRVDHQVPAVAAMLDHFRYLPNWRLDDIMISYAAPQGGVGPHVDNYDVFLIQGKGSRRWTVGEAVGEDQEIFPNDEIRHVKAYAPIMDTVLMPGDILYIPPRCPHEGIALEACMTYSVGFRAPSQRDLVKGFVASLEDDFSETLRYSDPDLQIQDNPGEIRAEALERAQRLVLDAMSDKAAFADFFGRYLTWPKGGLWEPDEEMPAETIWAEIAGEGVLIREPATRIAYIVQPNAIQLYVSSEAIELEPSALDCVQVLAGQCEIPLAELRRFGENLELRNLLTTLIQKGYWVFNEI